MYNPEYEKLISKANKYEKEVKSLARDVNVLSRYGSISSQRAKKSLEKKLHETYNTWSEIDDKIAEYMQHNLARFNVQQCRLNSLKV